jgi:energy-coupling factor transporter ATP-binding protein EcfA2
VSVESLVEDICPNHNVDSASYAPYVSITYSTIGGYITGGVFGAALGFSAGYYDASLAWRGVPDEHYITRSLYWSSVYQPYVNMLSNFAPAYKPFIYGCNLALSTASSYNTNDFMSFKEKIDTPMDSFFTVNKLFDHKEIISTNERQRIYDAFNRSSLEGLNVIREDIIELWKNNPFAVNLFASVSLTTVNLLVNNQIQRALGSYAGNLFSANLVSNNIQEMNLFRSLLELKKNDISVAEVMLMLNIAEKYIVEVLQIIGISTVSLAYNTGTSLVSQDLYNKNYKMIIDQSTKILLHKGNGKKIIGASKKEGEEIIKNIIGDLWGLKEGANKLGAVYAESMSSLVQQSNLIKYAPDAILPYLLSLLPHQLFLDPFLVRSKDIAETGEKVSTSANNIIGDIQRNVKQIGLRDAEEYTAKKFNDQWKRYKEVESIAKSISTQKTTVEGLIDIWKKILDTVYFGSKYLLNTLEIQNFLVVKTSVDTIYKYLSSNIDAQEDNIAIHIAKGRIDRMFELIDAPDNYAARIINEDGQTIFKDYSLRLNSQEMVRIDNLVFEQGKHYAITGNSGCGKSSAMIDLKEGVVGALSSIGEISTPDGAEIMFLNQDLYFPAESTFLETLYFPNSITNLSEQEVISLRSKILSLLAEIKIDAFVGNIAATESLLEKLDSDEFALSGGQKQKVAAIQAILSQPDVLIMDENLTGLDENSLITIQYMINKYLPNATLIVIDHKADDNNYNGFYDMKVKFTTYSFKLLHGEENYLEENEIGLLLDNGQLFCAVNEQPNLEIIAHDDEGIPLSLYNKLSESLNSLSKSSNSDLKTEEKQQLMKFVSTAGYTTKTAWVETSEMTSKLFDESNLEEVDIVMPDEFVYGQLYGICLEQDENVL